MEIKLSLVIFTFLYFTICNLYWCFDVFVYISVLSNYFNGVQTLQTQDSSDPTHFGRSAKVSVRQPFSTSAKLSGHIGSRHWC